MKLSKIASLAEKIIATIIFVLLVTVLSIPDYPVTSQNLHNQTEMTASIAHHLPVVN